MSALTDAQYELFEQLTSRTLLVLDLEWAQHEKTEHIVAIAITPVVRGKRTTDGELYRVVNPGVPIDPGTQAIHGFTDADVHRKHRFHRVAPVIANTLDVDDAVLVCHGAIDARVLGEHFTRLGDRPDSTLGLDCLPDLPLLDSTRLPRLVQHPVATGKPSVSLPDLCAALGVDLKSHHNARADARATAEAVIQLLRYAAAQTTFASIEDLLAVADHGTLRAPKGRMFARTPARAPALPPEHARTHAAAPLTHEASPQELALWLDRAVECVAHRCPLLAEEVELAAPNNGAALLAPLTAMLSSDLAPGQAGTLVGALDALLSSSGPLATATVTSPALPSSRAVAWWRPAKPQIASSAACSTYEGTACPSCWRGDGCPRDLVHQRVAEAVVYALGPDGVDLKFIRDRLMSAGEVGKAKVAAGEYKNAKLLDRWAVFFPLEAAYVLELLCVEAERRGRSTARFTSRARRDSLELLEPRLALRVLNQELPVRGYEHTLRLAETAMSKRTTDPAYDVLESWVAMQGAAEEQRRRQAVPRVIVKPRLARPDGRVPANPYRPF